MPNLRMVWPYYYYIKSDIDEIYEICVHFQNQNEKTCLFKDRFCVGTTLLKRDSDYSNPSIIGNGPIRSLLCTVSDDFVQFQKCWHSSSPFMSLTFPQRPWNGCKVLRSSLCLIRDEILETREGFLKPSRFIDSHEWNRNPQRFSSQNILDVYPSI